MADKKISALTASTTPLAGTEVLPIVQGGSTVKVAVSNLTAGRAVSASDLSLTATVTGNVTPVLLARTTGNIADQQSIIWQQNDLTNLQYSSIAASVDGVDSGSLRFKTASGGTNTERMRIASTGDITASTGNLVVGTAGKGIDFSANGGDVLSQYDEGTFTATLTCTTGTITLNSSQDLMQYTRIGRMVFVSGQIVVSSVSSPTGILTLGGLPFTVNGSLGELAGRGAITVVAEGVGITVNNVVGYFLTGGTTANIYKYAAGNTANMAADVSASSSFLINMWYVAA